MGYEGASLCLWRVEFQRGSAMADYILFAAIILGIVMSLLYAHGSLTARKVGRMGRRQTHAD
jgi:hypothetical protein